MSNEILKIADKKKNYIPLVKETLISARYYRFMCMEDVKKYFAVSRLGGYWALKKVDLGLML